jgi:hypothetical protein
MTALLVRDALRSAGVLNNARATKLSAAVSITISLWRAEKSDAVPSRVQHNHLKEIWKMLQENDPPIGQIRLRFQSLPYASRFYLRRRASRLWPKAFDFRSDCDPFTYIEHMGKRQLLRRLPRLIAEGEFHKQGATHEFEPTIMGVTRGFDDGPKGGRPRGDDELRLITYLALDWLYATGQPPARGRNTEKGFGELVRRVFEEVTDLKADQALRRYWGQAAKCY